MEICENTMYRLLRIPSYIVSCSMFGHPAISRLYLCVAPTCRRRADKYAESQNKSHHADSGGNAMGAEKVAQYVVTMSNDDADGESEDDSAQQHDFERRDERQPVYGERHD